MARSRTRLSQRATAGDEGVLGAPTYRSEKGALFNSSIEAVIEGGWAEANSGSVDLLFTSPPFPLVREKDYGNRIGKDYRDWLVRVFSGLLPSLKPTGSLVVEIGNAWVAGHPAMSLLPTQTLLAIAERCNLYLCQEFVSYNPARMPGPIEWVNVRRLRVKDAFTHIWWLSPTENPKADNKRVLLPYGKAMRQLLSRQSYNAGLRPSEWTVSERGFLKDNGGAIPSNVLTASNTASNDKFQKACRDAGVKPHPARMPAQLVDFFVSFLTDEDDLVLDPFAGTNTTGWVAEGLNRRWLGIERDRNYAVVSQRRFDHRYLRPQAKPKG